MHLDLRTDMYMERLADALCIPIPSSDNQEEGGPPIVSPYAKVGKHMAECLKKGMWGLMPMDDRVAYNAMWEMKENLQFPARRRPLTEIIPHTPLYRYKVMYWNAETKIVAPGEMGDVTHITPNTTIIKAEVHPFFALLSTAKFVSECIDAHMLAPYRPDLVGSGKMWDISMRYAVMFKDTLDPNPGNHFRLAPQWKHRRRDLA
ncbi:hypothetical protein BJ165DRAFT_1190747 [Panaeolus papilionaceus]|nr:hypothetical protein BJ165DRAFT_1190747 [Panaeolus papilionaceus]